MNFTAFKQSFVVKNEIHVNRCNFNYEVVDFHLAILWKL